MYLASYYYVLITNEMHSFLYNQLFIFHCFCLLYMFRTKLVFHHQEHCEIWYNREGQSRLACTTVPYFDDCTIFRSAPDDERLVLFEICRADKKQ